MDATTYLCRIYKIEQIIANKLDELQELQEVAKIVGRNKTLADLQKEVSERITELLKERQDIITTIEQVDSCTDYKVLYGTYIKKKSMQQLSDEEGIVACEVYSRAIKRLKSVVGLHE